MPAPVAFCTREHAERFLERYMEEGELYRVIEVDEDGNEIEETRGAIWPEGPAPWAT